MIENRRKQLIRNCTGPDCIVEESHKKRIFSRLIFYFLVLCFIGTSIYLVFYSPYLRIITINIEGNTELSSKDISINLEKMFGGNYWGFIPKNNFTFIFPSNVEKIIKNDFKKIKKINVSKNFPDTLNIKIEEYSALLVWCVSEKCYMVDDNGVAYLQADFNSPQVSQNHLIRINDLSGQSVELGSEVINSEYAAYVMSLKDSLQEVGVGISEDAFQTPSRMAEEIDVKNANGVQFLFSTEYSQQAAIKALDLILKKQIPVEQQGNIAYIDLRSEGKAFYKMNGEVDPTVADSEESKSGDEKTVNKKK
jgi:cell division septal protein FtsQ